MGQSCGGDKEIVAPDNLATAFKTSSDLAINMGCIFRKGQHWDFVQKLTK